MNQLSNYLGVEMGLFIYLFANYNTRIEFYFWIKIISTWLLYSRFTQISSLIDFFSSYSR